MALELVPHTPHWSHAFAEEAMLLRRAVGESLLAIHHIGSTAIPTILAKPIIDVLCVVTSLAAVDSATPRLQALGYAAKGEHGIVGRRYFQKRDAQGERSYHVHVYEVGHDAIERHLAFRDFLLAHPAAAAQYSAVKRLALTHLPLTRQAYQERKAPYIEALQAQAIAWYRLQ